MVFQRFPVRKGTLGPDVIDIGALYQGTGHFAYDLGFMSTASCESKITFIDGDKGVLLYRGYPIDQLAGRSDFVETCYLLLYSQLPTREQYQAFRNHVVNHTMVNEQVTRFYTGFRRDAHPMAVMLGVVGALSAFYHDSTDISDPRQREIASIRMLAKMPTIAAMAYKYSMGQPFIHPRNELDCFAVPREEYKVDPVLARAMDRIFILHADHEQNPSTSTVRLAGSTGANPFACISAGIACLWGPAYRYQRCGGTRGDGSWQPHRSFESNLGQHVTRDAVERLLISCRRRHLRPRPQRPDTPYQVPIIVTHGPNRAC